MEKFKTIISDALVVGAVGITIWTTYKLNQYIACYLFALSLFGLSYFVAKR